MSDKTFKIVDGDMSDGYHTFDELYEHRCLLWINLCMTPQYSEQAFWIKEHYKGWDLLVLETKLGQISYHVPMTLRDLYYPLNHKPENYTYDGHTSKDVIERLRGLIK